MEFDASISTPGPSDFGYKNIADHVRIPVDIHFGDSILSQCEIPKDLSLVVVREPESFRCIGEANQHSSHAAGKFHKFDPNIINFLKL